MKIKTTLSIMLIICIAIWVYWTNQHIEVTHITVKDENIPHNFNGFKIAQVSDLHNKEWKDQLIDHLAQQKPDIIAVTGDLIDSSHTNTKIALNFIRQASQVAPIYYITGNHEAGSAEYPKLKKELIKLGVHLMDDRQITLDQGNEYIQLLGIQDPNFDTGENEYSHPSIIVKDKLVKLIDHKKFSIVLSHRPELFNTYVDAKCNLVLTGHAHGGQVRIPFVGGLIAPNQGFFPKYTEGSYIKNKTTMVVSRGLGNSIIPVRINNMPELVIAELKSK